MDSFTSSSINAICALASSDPLQSTKNPTPSFPTSEISSTADLPFDLEHPSDSGAVADFGYCIIA
uniref:Pheromone n=1 Tax=Lentinula edodes TaxID=5353 RepID=T1RLM3_LENED|nr:pheromone precursor [Lentinula edodes]AGC14701.1 pheromone precursor [Lentinula edodes]AGL07719.1 pheromone precursor [Lentinula edodes]AGL08101.1 pheromone precursor [Lentinula edodes]AWT58014.1 Pheromone [Lentinula edodes]